MLHRLSLLLLLLCRTIVAPYTLLFYDLKAWGIQRDPVLNGDGYVKVYCNNRHFGTTKVKNNTRNPVWEEYLGYNGARHGNRLKVQVFDKDIGQDKQLGYCVTKIKMASYSITCTIATGTKFEYSYNMD